MAMYMTLGNWEFHGRRTLGYKAIWLLLGLASYQVGYGFDLHVHTPCSEAYCTLNVCLRIIGPYVVYEHKCL